MAKQGTKIALKPYATTESLDESALIDVEPENQEEIVALAYQLWQHRGCPIGSPEQDWFQAERQLQDRKEKSREVA